MRKSKYTEDPHARQIIHRKRIKQLEEQITYLEELKVLQENIRFLSMNKERSRPSARSTFKLQNCDRYAKLLYIDARSNMFHRES